MLLPWPPPPGAREVTVDLMPHLAAAAAAGEGEQYFDGVDTVTIPPVIAPPPGNQVNPQFAQKRIRFDFSPVFPTMMPIGYDISLTGNSAINSYHAETYQYIAGGVSVLCVEPPSTAEDQTPYYDAMGFDEGDHRNKTSNTPINPHVVGASQEDGEYSGPRPAPSGEAPLGFGSPAGASDYLDMMVTAPPNWTVFYRPQLFIYTWTWRRYGPEVPGPHYPHSTTNTINSLFMRALDYDPPPPRFWTGYDKSREVSL